MKNFIFLLLLLSLSCAGRQSSSQQAEEVKKPVKYCCMAMIATCLACSEGISVEEFCQKKPKTPGCKQQK